MYVPVEKFHWGSVINNYRYNIVNICTVHLQVGNSLKRNIKIYIWWFIWPYFVVMYFNNALYWSMPVLTVFQCDARWIPFIITCNKHPFDFILLELPNDCVNILQKKNEALITDDIWIRFMDSKSLFFTRTRQA